MRNRYDLARMRGKRKPKRRSVSLNPIEPSRIVERKYYVALHRMVRGARKVTSAEVVPAATRAHAGAPSLLSGALNALQHHLARGLDSTVAMIERLLRDEQSRHTDAWIRAVRGALGIDLAGVIADEDLSDEFGLIVRRNVALVRGLSDDMRRRVETTVGKAVIEGAATRVLTRALREDFGFADRRAKLIARDQTAKITSDLSRLRQEQAGLTKYRWSTSLDERVRPTHRANEGRVFEWDDPPSTTGHPGSEIACRCTAAALVEFESAGARPNRTAVPSALPAVAPLPSSVPAVPQLKQQR